MADIVPTALGNLDAKRLQRAAARAARQEARGETLPIVFGGKTIAVLEAEFSLYILEPVQDINLDVALLFQQAMAISNSTSDDSSANIELMVSVLAANPDLPKEFIGAVKEIGRRLLGPDGYKEFCAQHPTPWDIAALITMLMSWYGLTLGEFWGSSTPSSDGATSNTISGPTQTVSTPVEYGPTLVTPPSSASVASPY